MVGFSPRQLLYLILFLALSLIFSGWEWPRRSGSIAKKVVTDGQLAGAVVGLYVVGAVEPWSWAAGIAWTIILLSSSMISTAVAWLAAGRVSNPLRRQIAGVSIGLAAGAATVATEAFILHQARPDLLTDSIPSLLAIGAFVGALAGVFLEFSRRRAWAT